MIYSNACGYAIRAVVRLASLRPQGYVLLDELCQDTDLPRHFVAKIFQDLVRQGVMLSAKGRGGGFALAKPASEVRLYDIVAVVDGVEQFDQCVVGIERCSDTQSCPLHDSWKPLRQQIKSFLLNTTVDRMSESLLRKYEMMGRPLPDLQNKGKPVRLQTK